MKNILNEQLLLDYLRSDSDPWVNTPLQGYVFKDNKKKGKYGELLVELMSKKLNYTLTKRVNTGHDIVINNYKTEIKFSVINAGKGYIFNHVSREKDWDRIIFATINNECEPSIVWTTKSELFTLIDSDKYFVRQQGGSSGSNDDWMFNSKQDSWIKFKSETCIKEFSEW